MGIYIKGMQMPESGFTSSIKICWTGEVVMETPAGWEIVAIATPVPEHVRLIDADKLIDRLEKQRTVILHQLPGVHSRTDGYTSEDYVFERNGDMISILRNYAAIVPADREGEA